MTAGLWFVIVTSKEQLNCPKDSLSKHPDCDCYYAEYDAKAIKCINHKCPELSEGQCTLIAGVTKIIRFTIKKRMIAITTALQNV